MDSFGLFAAGKKRRQRRKESLFEEINNHGKPRKIIVGFVVGFLIITCTAILAHEFFSRQVEFLFDEASWPNSFLFSWASVLGTTGDKIFDIDNSYNFKLMCITHQTLITCIMLWAFY